MVLRGFSLCDLSVALSSQEAALAAAVAALWHELFAVTELPTADVCPAIVVELVSIDRTDVLLAVGEPIFEAQRLQIERTAVGFRLCCGQASFTLDLLCSRALCALDDAFWRLPGPDQQEFFLLGFLMLLRHHGRYGLHANGLLDPGAAESGCLLVGRSGSGKTTLTLALLRAGWHYLSDDAIMLRHAPSGIAALAFRRGFSCTPATLAQMPDLFEEAHRSALTSGGKVRLDLERLYGDRFLDQCHPQLLLFPQVAHRPQTQLVALDATQTLLALIQQSPGILIDRAAAARQLEALKALAQQARSYRLLLGADVYTDAARVSALLRAA